MIHGKQLTLVNGRLIPTEEYEAEKQKQHDKEVRAKAIDEFAYRMIIMMPSHKADILLNAEMLKVGGK